ncbi:MAG: hypothetical protein A3D28_06300 [Omnitrophica bacterium RIFCSPHIGHO2_02_FULL_63_14]|nr:MAG: hypothetical protein A3D28_06300 [Omnitrophica bacterium RIFCSPHIGHO2_02_FULL_63_14]
MPIKFGTDGWRALMDGDFTPANVELTAQAFADWLNGRKKKRVVVGYDFRDRSDEFARSVTEVLIGNGIEVLLAEKATPTPAVSSAILHGGYDAGVVITASHNPPGYNGIKIKNDFGGSAEKSITDAIEALIGANPVRKKAFSPGRPVIKDLNLDYLGRLVKYLNVEAIKLADFRVLIDSMHGVGGRHIENILKGGRMRVTTLRAERDVTFGGVAPEPIAKNLTKTIELMRTGQYDAAFVTDGDADRVGAVRPGGEFVSPGTLLALIMLHMAEDLGRKGSVVTTISNTALIYKVARRLGLKIHETAIGFKYVCEFMRRENVLIGGEESGGIGFQDYLFERDGMLSCLLVMQMMAMRRQSFEEILKAVEKEFGKLYYVRSDLEYPNELKSKLFQHLQLNHPASIEGHSVRRIDETDGIKIILDNDSWLLFRLSGTEPILRVYSEAASQGLAEGLVRYGRSLAFHLPVGA